MRGSAFLPAQPELLALTTKPLLFALPVHGTPGLWCSLRTTFIQPGGGYLGEWLQNGDNAQCKWPAQHCQLCPRLISHPREGC